MDCFLNRALPFCLALFAGIALASFVSHEESTRNVLRLAHVANETALKIDSVPDLDFSDAAKKSGGAAGSLRLIALFDADGSVKEIKPYPMLPYGVPESEAGHGKFAEYTPMMIDGRFVNELPYSFTETAIEQLREIRFTPKTSDGKAVSEWVMVNTVFSFNDSRWSFGCNSIYVTLMDDKGTIWHGETWVDRNRGCTEI